MKRSLGVLGNDAKVWASRALNRSFARPDWVSINLTLRCNLSCTMCTTCYDSPELSHRQILDIIDQVAAWGVKILNPLGGEPFVRDDLVEILEYAARKDLFITLTTNGTLITPEHARRIARIAVNRLHFNFSIDGFEDVHDHIRGRGMLARTLEGFRHIREADAAAGNGPRKIVVNTVVNDQSLERLIPFIHWVREEGFSGVQLLNLFKHGKGVPREIKHLWIHPERWPLLDSVVEEIKALKARIDPLDFEIVNSPHQLDIMKLYYRERLPPREAPCFAGWKELYINANGQGIMCDGKLDFLNGQFGDVGRQTLQQMWESDALRSRREAVKACDSPCIQDCYLREPSDHMWGILKGIGGIAADEVRKRVARPPKAVALAGTELTLELSDVDDLPAVYHPTDAGARFEDFVQGSPMPFEALYDDPFLFYDYRNKGHLSFNRGFMGLELIKKLGPQLGRAKQRFETVRLGWRGEATLHPELALVLEELMGQVRQGRFSRIRLDTHGALLNSEYVDRSLEGDVAQLWVVHVDAASPQAWAAIRGQDRLSVVQRNVDYLLARRAALGRDNLKLVLAFTCLEENKGEAAAFRDFWLGRFKGHGLAQPSLAVGEMPAHGDAIWFRRQDCQNFVEQLDARRRMEAVATELGLSVAADRDTGAAPRCPSPFKTPTISWDGKLTLCTQDRNLALRAGEITVEDLVDIWWKKPGPKDARAAVLRGTLHQRSPCRDCRFPFSPNAPTLSDDERRRVEEGQGG